MDKFLMLYTYNNEFIAERAECQQPIMIDLNSRCSIAACSPRIIHSGFVLCPSLACWNNSRLFHHYFSNNKQYITWISAVCKQNLNEFTNDIRVSMIKRWIIPSPAVSFYLHTNIFANRMHALISEETACMGIACRLRSSASCRTAGIWWWPLPVSLYMSASVYEFMTHRLVW